MNITRKSHEGLRGGSPIKGEEPEQLYDVIPTGQLLRDERACAQARVCVRAPVAIKCAGVRVSASIRARHAQVIMVEGLRGLDLQRLNA